MMRHSIDEDNYLVYDEGKGRVAELKLSGILVIK